jgi:hypothetical protein
MSAQRQISRHIIIRDKGYNIVEFKTMREELLKKESKALEDKLRNDVNNFVDWLSKMFNSINTYISKIFNRIKFSSKKKKIDKKDSEKGDMYEETQNKVEEM